MFTTVDAIITNVQQVYQGWEIETTLVESECLHNNGSGVKLLRIQAWFG